jgi:enoyl-[acyl-carrier-protein] reductase (NADH)
MVVFLHNRGTAHAVILTAKMKLTAAAAGSSQARTNPISAGVNRNLTITIGAGFPAADTYSDSITATRTNN